MEVICKQITSVFYFGFYLVFIVKMFVFLKKTLENFAFVVFYVARIFKFWVWAFGKSLFFQGLKNAAKP